MNNLSFTFYYKSYWIIFLTMLLLNSNYACAQKSVYIRKEQFEKISEVNNNKINVNGNIFELWAYPIDTVWIEDPFTGEREMKITSIDSFPITMNGIKIATEKDCNGSALPERSLNEYIIDLVNNNKALFNNLADGTYNISLRHFVVSETGQLLYYKFEGIEKMPRKTVYLTTNKSMVSKPNKEPEMNESLEAKASINKLIRDFFDSGVIKFEAAQKEGKKILSIGNGAGVSLTVKNHLASVDL